MMPVMARNVLESARLLTAAARLLADKVLDGASPDWPTVLNGRFTGGYITRTYGRPHEGVHAVQLEMAERAYMDEGAPYRYREDKAQRLIPVLRKLIETARDWARAQG
jgi:N-formylglutamate amidohydrolase